MSSEWVCAECYHDATSPSDLPPAGWVQSGPFDVICDRCAILLEGSDQ